MDTEERLMGIVEDILYKKVPKDIRSRDFRSVNTKDDLGANCIDRIELEMAIEEEFDINIPDDDLFTMATLGDLFDYIENNSPARQTGIGEAEGLQGRGDVRFDANKSETQSRKERAVPDEVRVALTRALRAVIEHTKTLVSVDKHPHNKLKYAWQAIEEFESGKLTIEQFGTRLDLIDKMDSNMLKFAHQIIGEFESGKLTIEQYVTHLDLINKMDNNRRWWKIAWDFFNKKKCPK